MSSFPATMFSAVLQLQSGDPLERQRSLERLIRAYTKPVYKHLRLKWQKPPADADDLVQDFFARAVERGIFALYDPDKGRFRTFVRSCLDHFVINAEESRTRLKRGGGLEMVAADTLEAEHEIGVSSAPPDPDAVFDREWARNLFDKSIVLLEKRLTLLDKARYFEAFRRHDLCDEDERPSYATLASELGIKVTDVTNYLHAARKELRVIVLETLRELTATEEEFRLEAKALLGVDPPPVMSR